MTVRWNELDHEHKMFAVQLASRISAYPFDEEDMVELSRCNERFGEDTLGVRFEEFEYTTHAEYDAFNAGLLE